MPIFKAILRDHERQRLLLKILVETSGDTNPRKEYYEDLKKELEQHAIAEERSLYKPLMESDKSIEASRHAIAEHHQIDKLIETLDETDRSSPVWLKTLKDLQHKVEHHLAEEEEEFFPLAREVLSSTKLAELSAVYQAEMKSIRS